MQKSDTLVILLVGVSVGGRDIAVSRERDIGEGGVVGVVVSILDLDPLPSSWR